jgi:hypothetical protein
LDEDISVLFGEETSSDLGEKTSSVGGEDISSGIVKTLSLTLVCALPSGEANMPRTVGRFWLDSSGFITASDFIDNNLSKTTGDVSGVLGESDSSPSLSLTTAEKNNIQVSVTIPVTAKKPPKHFLLHLPSRLSKRKPDTFLSLLFLATARLLPPGSEDSGSGDFNP